MSNFNLEDYRDNFTMHCKTAKEAREFCSFLHRNNRMWSSGASYLEYTNWENYKDNTVYFFNEGTYGDLHRTYKDDYIALEWSDYNSI